MADSAEQIFHNYGMETSRGRFFSNWANSSGHFLRVNSRGHFVVVITNGWSANAEGAGTKPLLGSANTVPCQVRGCVGEAPAKISEYCSVSGLG